MKFDIVIGNPPYNNNLDLKILRKVYPLCDRLIFVHPAGCLYDNRTNGKLFNIIKEQVRSSFGSFHHILHLMRIIRPYAELMLQAYVY